MDPLVVGLLGLLALAVLIILQVPIGFAMLAVGLLGYGIMEGFGPAFSMLGTEVPGIVTSLDLAAIPLFLLMGSFANIGGLSADIYEVAFRFLGHRRGGISLATIVGCGVFGAISSSSVATATTFGRIALPEMLSRGYAPHFAAGTVAAGGTLGVLVPPSGIIIIYGVMTNTFILDLFVAAAIPAVLAVALYMLAVLVYLWFHPEAAPKIERAPWSERLAAIRGSWTVIAFILIVLGGMYGGVFTVDEAAAIAAILSLALAIARKRMTWAGFWSALSEAASNTAMIYFVIIGASVMTYFVTVTHTADALVDFVNSFNAQPMVVILLLLMMYIVLGSIFDTISAMLITLPFVMPIIVGLGFDPVWWGIVNIVVIELGLITPPIGLNVFVLNTVAKDIPLLAIFRGVVPFICADLVRLALITMFPVLSLWLVRALN